MNTKHPFVQYLSKHQFIPAIGDLPVLPPRMIVALPSYKEPDLLQSLEALYNCRRPSCFVEVIVVINHPEKTTEEAKQQNEKNLRETLQWAKQHNDNRLQFHIVYKPDVPEKVAGVGFARKTGMDEAVYRFQQTGVNDGVIIGFDADAKCDENYFEEIEKTFFSGKHVNGASIYYEHPVDECEFSASVRVKTTDRAIAPSFGGNCIAAQQGAQQLEGIVLYELHLRYLNQALRYAGFPYAFHTVGSSFAVSASAYVKQGGMNKRKAGEDFHFLQKIISLGDYVEINTTRVIPSPRPSDRVPFGTGASISQWIKSGHVGAGLAPTLQTYPLEPFDDLKQLFALVPLFYKTNSEEVTKLCTPLPYPIQEYLTHNDYLTHITQANANSASPEAFAKRFFGWFDGLKTIKYLNESCRKVYVKQNPEVAAEKLLTIKNTPNGSSKLIKREIESTGRSAKELLQIYRKIERNEQNSG